MTEPDSYPGTNSAAGAEPPGSPPPVDPRTELTMNEQVGHYVDMWKKTVDVQQHFNDIEWRIRGLALTVATFALGAAGVAAKDDTRVGWFSLGALVIVIGLLLWYAFYFVDRVWYHPLLRAAVAQGTRIEDEIKRNLPEVGMTAAITAGSSRETGRLVGFLSRRNVMHSEDKLVWFYKVGAFALLAAAIALQAGALLKGDRSSDRPIPRTDVPALMHQMPAPDAPVLTHQVPAPDAPASTHEIPTPQLPATLVPVAP